MATAGAGGHADTGSAAHIAQFVVEAGAVDSAVAKFAAIPAAGARITHLARESRAELYRWLDEVLLRLISTGPRLFTSWFGVSRRLLLYPLSRRLNPCGLGTGEGDIGSKYRTLPYSGVPWFAVVECPPDMVGTWPMGASAEHSTNCGTVL